LLCCADGRRHRVSRRSLRTLRACHRVENNAISGAARSNGCARIKLAARGIEVAMKKRQNHGYNGVSGSCLDGEEYREKTNRQLGAAAGMRVKARVARRETCALIRQRRRIAALCQHC